MKIDKSKFFPTILTIIVVLIVVSFNLEKVQSYVNQVYDTVAGSFGWLFILSNICAFIFSVWIIISPKGKIKLGGAESKPEYSRFSWISMMFTTSCSAGLLVFGFIESIIYTSDPPFQIEAFSLQAYEYSTMYTHYHWGLNAWSLYIPASIAIAYCLYNRRDKKISLSSACSPILKTQTNGLLGKLIDVLGTFGAVIAPVTSMGLGMPLLTLLLQKIFSIPESFIPSLRGIILIIWILIFGTSVYLGLEKGIKNLSNANVALAFAFMVFVGGLSGMLFILRSEINTIGLYISNFVRMATYTDPYGDALFVNKWTIWYWAWLIVYMPLMGVFNARISKGRTLREVAIGQMVFCSMGCWVAMMTLGNYAVKIQKSGIADIAHILKNSGQPAAILAIIETMPNAKLVMIIVVILCFVFMATTVDSSSFVAAEMTMKVSDNTAPRWSRVFWASVSCVVTFVLLKVGGFDAVQVLAILTGFPLAIIMFVIVASVVKLLKENN